MSITLKPYVAKSGEWLHIGCQNDSTGAPANITAVVANTLGVRVNGVVVSAGMGPAVWTSDASTHQNPFVGYKFPTPVLAGDLVEYTLAANALVTASGNNAAVSSFTAIPNNTGHLETVYGGMTSFSSPPVAPMGVDTGWVQFLNYHSISPSKNARKRLAGFTKSTGTTAITYDTDDPTLPLSWNPGGKIWAQLAHASQGNGINALGNVSLPGQYSIVFDDLNANDPTKALIVWLSTNQNTCAGGDTTNSGLVKGSRPTPIGNTVTVTYNLQNKFNPNYSFGYDYAIDLYMISPTGKFGEGGTITNFWIFFPGDEDNDRSDQLAVSANMLRILRTPNGKGPACLRVKESTLGFGGVMNFFEPEELIDPNAFAWNSRPVKSIPLVAARFYNTDPSDSTYAWSSPRFYHRELGNQTDPDPKMGRYIDLPSCVGVGGVSGARDCGDLLNYGVGGNPNPYAVVEFRCQSDHNLRSNEQAVTATLTGNAVKFLPITSGVGGNLAGTATVSLGSTTMKMSVSQIIAPNTAIIFDTDPTAQAYLIAAPGSTATDTFTINPGYAGPATTTAVVTKTAAILLNNAGSIVLVTGPKTFAMAWGATYNVTGGGLKTISAHQEIPLDPSKHILTTSIVGSVAPLEFYARIAAQLNSSLWMNLSPTMSPACIEAHADAIGPVLRPAQTIIHENGLEYWNLPGFRTGQITIVLGRLLQYLTTATAPSDYASGFGRYYPLPSTPAILNPESGYALHTARQQDIFKARLDIISPGHPIVRLMGAQYSKTSHTTLLNNFANLYNIPIGAYLLAPYIDGPIDVAWNAAFDSAQGNWSAAALNDLYRHYLKYSSTNIFNITSQEAIINNYTGPATPGQVGGKPAIYGYESSIERIDPKANPARNHDIWYHPSYADTWNAWAQSLQDGQPGNPNSGFDLIIKFNQGGLWGGGTRQQPWGIVVTGAQVAGDGSTNRFTTPQGGLPGDGKCYDQENVSVELKTLYAWWDATSPSATPGAGFGAIALPRMEAIGAGDCTALVKAPPRLVLGMSRLRPSR
jgi:hypothetical protein